MPDKAHVNAITLTENANLSASLSLFNRCVAGRWRGRLPAEKLSGILCKTDQQVNVILFEKLPDHIKIFMWSGSCFAGFSRVFPQASALSIPRIYTDLCDRLPGKLVFLKWEMQYIFKRGFTGKGHYKPV